MTNKQAIKKKKGHSESQNIQKSINDKGDDVSRERLIAECSLAPWALNSVTASIFNHEFKGADFIETVSVMKEKVSKVNNNDLSELEAILTSQAVALNVMFNELARRSALNIGEHINVAETYMRLSLKAQSQCTRTIEVLAAMKNPPVIFAKQANIANGHQQINNGNNATSTPAHAQEIESQPNELLEVNHGSKTMDTRTAQAASRKDKAMATVAK